MKSACILSVLATAVAAVPAGTLEARQMAGMGMGGGASGGLDSLLDKVGPLLANPGLLSMASNFMPSKAAYKIEEIPAQVRQGAKRVRITYGPYVLRGKLSKEKLGNTFSMDPSGTAYAYLTTSDFPRDITVLDTTSQIVKSDFTRAEDTDGVYNHHNVFVDFTQPPIQSMECADPAIKPKGMIPINVLMAGASETGALRYTTADGKFNSGYYVGPKDVIYNAIDVVNYNNDDMTVYTSSEMEYMPGKVADYLPAVQQTINLGLCSGSTNGIDIRPKPGTKNMTINGSGMMISRDGYLLNTRGHLHDGGDNMVLRINGEVACDSKVLYGGPGFEYTLKDGSKIEGIRTTTECDKPIPVKKGDKIDVVAKYDFAAHPQRESAGGEMAEDMALLILTFAENKPSTT